MCWGVTGALAVHAAASPAVVALLNTSDDDSVLQSCCEYLRCLLRAGGLAVLAAGGAAPVDTFREMVAALARLLAPNAGDRAALYVGPALLALLAVAPPEAAAAIPPLLSALTTKVVAADNTSVITGLLMVVAKMMSSHLEDSLACLSGLPSPTGDSSSALEAVMKVWVERCLEFSGRLQVNLSAVALAAMLCDRSCPAIDQIQVRGRRLDTSDIPRTRAQAAKQAEQWDLIPLRLKLFVVTVDALEEALAQGPGGSGAASESSWEDDDRGSDDSGDNQDIGAPFEVASPSLEKIIARAAAEEADDGEDPEDADLRGDPAAAIDLAPALTAALSRYTASVTSACGTRAVEYLTASQAATLRRVLPACRT